MAYHQGFFKPRNPHKYKGNPTQIVYRSWWECQVMMKYDLHPDVLEWSSEEIVIYYDLVEQGPLGPAVVRHRYFPDFWVKYKNRKGEIITEIQEVKPQYQTVPPIKKPKQTMKKYLTEMNTWKKNEAKWVAAKAYCKKRGWEFRVIDEYELGLKKPK